MNSKTNTLSIDNKEIIPSEANIANNKNKSKPTIIQKRLAIISKKLNLCVLVNYK
jgi:hypothetical protein